MSVDEMRAGLHDMWASVAPGWEENADYIDSRAAPLSARIIELAAPAPGDRVLELACGPGGLGLAIAPLVEPGGAVVASDVAVEMTTIAAARAQALGLANLTARPLDLEQIDEPDDSFDIAVCREGLMLVPDPARAAGEIRRVVRPGGRVVISVWGPRERNPWLGILLDAVSAEVGAPVPPPGVPGPFALEDQADFAAALDSAGFENVEHTETSVPLRAASFDEWWARTTALAGPLARLLASMPADAAERIRSGAQERVAAYETSAGLEIPGLTLVAAATA